MTVAPAIGLPWFKTPFGVDFNSWPRAARRLWEFFRSPRHQGADRFRFRDWELARALDVKRRVIQKGLRILERLGVIAREWIWGHDGGRVIVITLQLAGPKSKDDKKPRARPQQGPAPSTTPATTPAPTVARAAPRAEEDKPLTPEEQAEVDRFLEESRKRREAAAKVAAQKAAAEERRRTNARPAMTKEQALAQIAARRDAARPPEPPTGPRPEGRPPDPGG